MLTEVTEKVNQANAIKATGKRSNKKDIYAAFGIEYADGKIRNSLFGWMEPLLINGNDKLGKGVYTWSMLPTNEVFNININGTDYCVKGTCNCHCEGCYATTGRGKSMIVGYINIDKYEYIEKEQFDKMYMFHCVPAGSKYDCKKGSGKYCYWVSNPIPCEPYPVPENAVKHGRSWCEF